MLGLRQGRAWLGSNREVALSQGARWLRKPWQREELDAVIQEVLGVGRASPASGSSLG